MLVGLHDGTRVLLRPVRADDVPLLLRGLGQCSPATMRSRFLSPKPRFTGSELRYLTDVDQVDHVALMAVRADRPEVMAGIGRWIRDPDRHDRAEVAFLVVDAFHGLGLGKAIGLALADVAVAHDVHTLTATILADNSASQRILAAIAERLRTARGGAYDELVLDLPASTHRAEDLAAERDERFHEQPTLQFRRPAGARRRERDRPPRPPSRPGGAVPDDPDWARAA